MNKNDVLKDLEEWNTLLQELSEKEVNYFHLKDEYEQKSEEIIATTDFKEIYGKNNADVRRMHVKKELGDMANELKDLEFRIAYIKRRISYLKHVIRTKNSLMEVEQK